MPTSTTDARVSLAFSSARRDDLGDPLRVSGSPKLTSSGTLLRKGITMPVRESSAGTCPTRRTGARASLASRRVYAQVRDAAGNWSDVFCDEIELLEP